MSGTRITDALGRLVDAIPTEDDFQSSARSRALTARVGTWLGVCFLGWFAVTGLVLVAAALPAARDRREGAPRG